MCTNYENTISEIQMKRGIGPKIQELYASGLTLTQISKSLSCAISTVEYHVKPETKAKTLARLKISANKDHPYVAKTRKFRSSSHIRTKSTESILSAKRKIQFKVNNFKRTGTMQNENFSADDIIAKFGERPKCHFTGRDIDIYATSTYHFDHLIPVSRGGRNTLDNLAICCKDVNLAKRDMTSDEFINMCRQVVEQADNK